MEKLPSNNDQSRSVVEANSASFFQHNQKDIKSEYLSERVKKLVTAVYLVTNLISETDPLRHTIRDFSIKILSIIGRFPAGQSTAEVQQEVQNLVRKIVEMLEIAFFSGYVSEMNFSVLKSEFDLFIEEMMDYQNSQDVIRAESLKPLIQQETGVYHPVAGNVNKLKNSSTGGANSVNSGHFVQHGNAGNAGNAGNHGNTVNTAHRDSNQFPKRNVVEVKKNSRREAILSIMRRRGDVNIKDISSVVINCSEKTIQRELLELVEGGVIKKIGERRWSTYSLV